MIMIDITNPADMTSIAKIITLLSLKKRNQEEAQVIA